MQKWARKVNRGKGRPQQLRRPLAAAAALRRMRWRCDGKVSVDGRPKWRLTHALFLLLSWCAFSSGTIERICLDMSRLSNSSRDSFSVAWYLNNYFILPVHPFCLFVHVGVWKLATILAVLSQNLTKESCKWCVKSMRILKFTSVFQQLPSVDPKQLFVLAHLVCTREVGIT